MFKLLPIFQKDLVDEIPVGVPWLSSLGHEMTKLSPQIRVIDVSVNNKVPCLHCRCNFLEPTVHALITIKREGVH